MFLFKFPFGPLETNALLVGSSERKVAVAIDPSLGSCGAILAKASELGVKIEKIFLTHSHWDHFADAHALKEETEAPLYVHPLDAKNIEHPGSDGIPLFFPVHPVSADHFLNEGETIVLGDLHFEVIHSPGHSPGSVCFYLRAQKLLISGDTLFRGSMGNLQLPTAQANQMWLSLGKLAALPPETRVIPGHGPETTIGQENWLARAKETFSR